MTNPNPNEPTFPYSGGTDNPGDDTSHAGGPSNVAATETAPLTLSGPSMTASIDRHPALPVGLAAGGSDTVLPAGMQAVPPSGAGFESGADYGEERSADTGGVVAPGGAVRVPGQDETAGETETTPDTSPAAFPEPNP